MKITLKRLTHRTDEKKTAERYILNTVYKTECKSQMLLYPIPEFIEDKRCMCPSCNNEGAFMSDKYFVFCGSCASNQFENPILIQEKVLIVPSVDQCKNGNAFEWRIEGKDEWYKIKGSGITCDSTQRISIIEIKKRFDKLIYEVLCDEPQLCDGEYIKEEKKLMLYV